MESLQFFALKSVTKKKYLRYIEEPIINTLHDILQFSEDDATSPYAKFEAEKDRGNPELVHIKCTHNKKYLRKSDQSNPWIVAGAPDQVEDQTQWSCTLFKLEPVAPKHRNDRPRYRVRHVQLGNYIEPVSADDHQDIPYLSQPIPFNNDNFVFIVEEIRE